MKKRTLRGEKHGAGQSSLEPVGAASVPGELKPQSHAAGKMLPPRLTPYAERLLARAGASGLAAGEWISTLVAAELTGYSRRQIHALCDNGFFIEGKEWKQRPPCPGFRAGGWIWIRRSALRKLKPQA